MPSLVPFVPITLDRLRHIRLDNQALLLAEREISKLWDKRVNILQVFLDTPTLGLNDVCIVLWAGLRHEDPQLTLLQVQDLVGLAEYVPVLQALYEAWNSATASAVPSSEAAPVPLAQASPGNGSGGLVEPSLASVTVSSGS